MRPFRAKPLKPLTCSCALSAILQKDEATPGDAASLLAKGIAAVCAVPADVSYLTEMLTA